MSNYLVPSACILERRDLIRAEHIARRDALARIARALTGDDADLIDALAEREWDDAIHIAAADDPLRSLCGQYGRNLADLPTRPDSGSGCWTCLDLAAALRPEQMVAVS